MLVAPDVVMFTPWSSISLIMFYASQATTFPLVQENGILDNMCLSLENQVRKYACVVNSQFTPSGDAEISMLKYQIPPGGLS